MASTVCASPTPSLPRAPSRAARLPRRRASRTRGKGWRDDSPLDAGDATTRSRAKRSKTRKRGGTTGTGKGTEEGCELRAIDLGQGKSVELYVPRDDAVADVDGDRVSREVLEGFRDELYGAGDVVWPASVALARLLAHCPSLVRGKRVLEIGAGLGLVGVAAMGAGASEVCFADVDGGVLAMTSRSAARAAKKAARSRIAPVPVRPRPVARCTPFLEDARFPRAFLSARRVPRVQSIPDVVAFRLRV
jgi:hypothetical protein